MGEEIAISLKNVSKCYKLYARPVDRLKEILLPGKSRADIFWALHDINLEIPVGKTVGILGQNGSGKSTLLQTIAGTLTPTSGEVKVNGRLSALLELGSGFNPEFSGRQNVFFNGRLLGLSQEELEEKFDDIAAFADIGNFLDQPVKTYSSGMYVRLAFSVAINVSPKILIVDEALAVGDARFQQRCMTRINSLRDNGVTVLFVSHDAEAVKRLCDSALVMEKGKIINSGLTSDMVSWYLAFMTVDFDLEQLRKIENLARLGKGLENTNFTQADASHAEITERQTDGNNAQLAVAEKNSLPSKANAETEFKYFRHGDGKARITKTFLANENSQEVDFVYVGDIIKVYIEVEFLIDLNEYLIGMLVRDRLGTDIIGINTCQERINIQPVRTGDKYLYSFQFAINIKPGVYSISPSVAYDQYSMPWLDWVENAVVFQVLDPKPKHLIFGVYHPPERQIDIKKINHK